MKPHRKPDLLRYFADREPASGEMKNMGFPRKPHSRPHTWHPATDLYETESAFLVRVEIAGMNQEDLSVHLEEQRLDISGTRPDMPVQRAFHQLEIPHGNFRTTVDLPAPIQPDQVQAEYHDGFLLVTLPKKNPRIIPIKGE